MASTITRFTNHFSHLGQAFLSRQHFIRSARRDRNVPAHGPVTDRNVCPTGQVSSLTHLRLQEFLRDRSTSSAHPNKPHPPLRFGRRSGHRQAPAGPRFFRSGLWARAVGLNPSGLEGAIIISPRSVMAMSLPSAAINPPAPMWGDCHLDSPVSKSMQVRAPPEEAWPVFR